MGGFHADGLTGKGTELTAPQAGNDNADSATESAPQQAGNEFTPITSQEQLDDMFNRRWSREKAKIHEKYKGFDDLKAESAELKELKSKLQTEDERRDAAHKATMQQAADAAARADAAEKALLRQRIAIEEGLPPKFASRLTGETEDELRADAKETFGDFITQPTSFDHGARSKSAPQSMNDLIFGAANRR